jgi:hypothetical protein
MKRATLAAAVCGLTLTNADLATNLGSVQSRLRQSVRAVYTAILAVGREEVLRHAACR